MEINGWRQTRRSGWEYFLIFCVVGCSMLLSVALYAKRDQVYKERLLTWELLALRNYVTAYILEYKKHPEDLMDVTSPWSDPFGNPYRYDSKIGWVFSGTPGYEGW